MRLALYCREMRAGGTKAVGIGLLQALANRSWGHEITAYVPEDSEFSAIRGGSLRIVPAQAKGGRHHIKAHRRFLRQLAAERQDAIFMLGNRGLVGAPCPQAVLLHNPWVLYPESPAWQKCTLRDYLYRRVRNAFYAQGLRAAEVIAAQTPVMIQRLHQQFRIPYDRLALIPNSVTAAPTDSLPETETSRRMLAEGHTCRALCLARYYTHKNIEILLEAADQLLAQERTDIGIYITIEASHGSGARRVLEEMMRNGRERVLHNLGQIPMAHVASCYRVADCLLLPTLLESFTNTYVDAMQAGVPIITSDLDFAHTVCGDAAGYVDPLNSASIVAALDSLKTDPELWQQRVKAGQERAQRLFMSWDTIAERVVDLLACTAKRQSVAHLLNEAWVQETIHPSGPARAGREQPVH